MTRANKTLLLGFVFTWICLLGAILFHYNFNERLKESGIARIENSGYMMALHQLNDDLFYNPSNKYKQSTKEIDSLKAKLLVDLESLRTKTELTTQERVALRQLEYLALKTLEIRNENHKVEDTYAEDQTENELRRVFKNLMDTRFRENAKHQSDSTETLRSHQSTNNILLVIIGILSILGFIAFIALRRLTQEKETSKKEVLDFNFLLQGVFDSSQSGIMVFKAVRDDNGRVVDLEWVAVNKKGCRIINRQEEELVGHRLLTVSPMHTTNGLFESYTKVIETNVPTQIEYQFTRGDQTEIWLAISVSPIPEGVAITFSDISESKKSQLVIQESESNLQALINNTADEVWSVDTNLEIISANDAFRQRSKPVETTEFWTKILNRALKGEKFEEEISVPHRNGTLRLLNYHFSPIIGSEGALSGVAVFGHDITEKKNVEAQIRYQSKLLKSISKNIPMIIYTIQKDGMLLAIEGKALEMYNVDPKTAVGNNLLHIYPSHAEGIQKALGGEPSHFVWTNGGPTPTRFFDSYLFPDDNLEGTITGVSLDITPLKMSQLATEAEKQRAEEASAFKTRFLANMSHEIRTPLSSILGFADLLKREDKEPKHQEFLSHIETAGTTLLKLIGDILDLTKIEEGKMSIDEESFPLREILSSMLDPYQYTAREKGIGYKLQFLGDFPAYVIGDAGKLVQVLINLVGNAIKFTEAGGINIILEAEQVSDEKLLLLQVSVTDSGIGVPIDKQTSIFDAFSQADDGINRKFGGTGLGLSIAREMVRILGGHLEVESPVEHGFEGGGGGSRFYFTIPLQKDKSVFDVRIAPPNKKSIDIKGEYHILMVEDNPVNQRLGELILENTGCRLSFANNGKEAIELITTQAFQLVLMDVQMPVLDGLAATRIIRKSKPSLPIVGLSANVYKEDVDACIDSGMTDFLAKPYSSDKLLDMVVKYAPPHVSIAVQGTELALPDEVICTDSTLTLARIVSLFGGESQHLAPFIEAFNEVLDEFIDTSEGLSPQNWASKVEEISRISHKVKPNLELFELHHLQAHILTLEKASRKPYQADLLQLVKEVAAGFKQAKQAMESQKILYKV